MEKGKFKQKIGTCLVLVRQRRGPEMWGEKSILVRGKWKCKGPANENRKPENETDRGVGVVRKGEAGDPREV